MNPLLHSTEDERRINFENADEHLKQVFSKYPYPVDLDGCPCCVSEDFKETFKNGDLQHYFFKAMTHGEQKYGHFNFKYLKFISALWEQNGKYRECHFLETNTKYQSKGYRNSPS